MDDELNFRLQKATCAYGRLCVKVFENNNLAIHTKVLVYNAIILSTKLLYGCETWTLYRRQLRSLESFKPVNTNKTVQFIYMQFLLQVLPLQNWLVQPHYQLKDTA